ncbi:hypothetical protein GCM10010269_13470 [Streptomyces humidus]|uniref:Uncharacterized protein n=1 Tax=Streptomyces humidus TaxID=52259 RepID=A0A918L1N0_9ACTN|nr:hypothetical protein GCM10010269_13470 [Streptomyces humidus]
MQDLGHSGKIATVTGAAWGWGCVAARQTRVRSARGRNWCAGESLTDVTADVRSKPPDTGSRRRPLNALFLPRFRVGGARSLSSLSARNLRRGDPQPARL